MVLIHSHMTQNLVNPANLAATWPQPQPFVIYIKRALFAPRVAQRGVLMFHQASFIGRAVADQIRLHCQAWS